MIARAIETRGFLGRGGVTQLVSGGRGEQKSRIKITPYKTLSRLVGERGEINLYL